MVQQVRSARKEWQKQSFMNQPQPPIWGKKVEESRTKEKGWAWEEGVEKMVFFLSYSIFLIGNKLTFLKIN